MFYATPILYSVEIFGDSKIAKIIRFNPMAAIINSYRDVLYWGNMPHLKSLLIVLGFSLVFCYIGLLIFRHLSKGFAEEV